MPVPRPLGAVMLGIEGTALTAADRERLVHPHVGGVILFARNYVAPEPLRALTADLRQLREPALLIAVDHEGGRVQRFREGFTAIPPMRTLGERFDQDRDGALADAQRWGRMIADELGGCGIDFSFTPVLDLDAGVSDVIGRRAFHATPRVVGDLAAALCRGLHAGGMASVGKHFPGHGNVAEDSHAALPVDPRPYGEIAARDLLPFAQLAHAHLLDAVMPAHVLYPAVDAAPAGFSAKWLREILRGEIGFDGLIFSDDLEMAGAHMVGDIVARADAARSAGCDMVLACNDFTAMEELLERWRPSSDGDLAWRAAAMRRRT